MLHKQKGEVWMNGEFVDMQDANVHVLTHTLHYGSGVFEGMRAYNGRIFKMTEHHKRLCDSASMLGFEIPYNVEELNDAAVETLKRNGLKEAYVRPLAWYGPESLAVSSRQNSVNTAIAVWIWDFYFGSDNVGLKLTWSDWVRPAPTMGPVQAKANGQYITGTMGKNKAEKNGFHDALMKDYRGYLAEISSANVFFVKDGVLHTPIADCFLNGITRQTAIQIANDLGIPVRERHIPPEEILQADEVFITGTAAEIQPVGQIDDQVFPVGPITKKIRQAYSALVREK
ncbi:MAG: branched-chain amino acid aminotransferase [Alphaproteobacteria bacterium]